MNKRNIVLGAAVVVGLLAGVFTSSALTDNTQSQCEKTEEAIKQESNLSGAIACFPPGVIDVNQTDEVEEGADLECVCRRSYEGTVQFWNINKAN